MDCRVDDCDKPTHSKGLCGMHLMRMKRTGTTDPTGRAVTNRLSPEERFWLRVDVRGPEDCWPWTGTVGADGYGTLKPISGGGTWTAHSYAHTVTFGPVGRGKTVDHACHSPEKCQGGPSCPHRRCCNPSHLRPATPKQQADNGHVGRNGREKTECPAGHEYTPENTYVLKGRRSCRACHRARERERRRVKRGW